MVELANRIREKRSQRAMQGFPQKCHVFKNIRYYSGPESHDKHELDLYLPHDETIDPTRPVPVLLHVHGGGWQRGDRSAVWRGGPPCGYACGSSGIATVVISYRLAPPSVFGLFLRSVVLALFISALFVYGVSWVSPVLQSWPFSIVFPVVFGILFLSNLIYFHCFGSYHGKVRYPAQVEDVCQAISWVKHNLPRFYPPCVTPLSVLQATQPFGTAVPRDGHRCSFVLEHELKEASVTGRVLGETNQDFTDISKEDGGSNRGGRELPGLFLSGHSAGGHLVSLVATKPDFLTAAGVSPSILKGVISVSGIYNLSGPLASHYTSWRNFIFRSLYTLSAFGNDPDIWVQASPVEQVTSDCPPFLLLSASSDLGLEYDATRFASVLKERNVESEHVTISNTSHASIASMFHQNGASVVVTDFIRKLHARLYA
eukprot:TRINITY_DN3439_c0_g1_i1.p1 TRINITY_DN3439_c0_g1~~TRINITY_DN3439_c0_g1_i1.p1  ORF type:complete len:429 (-),score=40.46 TRINITY_DN3439_c0_g1_i1:68-1354(-)